MTNSSRRDLLKQWALVSAATALPAWVVQECRAADEAKPKEPAESEKLGIVLVGCGGMGTGDAKNAAKFANIVAVCDVDSNRVDAAKKAFPGAVGFSDFRQAVTQKSVDAVICATVDHWHTLVSMAAMKAGKDVYCEKPMTLTIDEGKRLVEVQKQTKRILQTGTQQRSSVRFRMAVELIRNGRIGKLQHVEVFLPAGRREGPFKPAAVPDGFDFETWMGPTPKVDYVKERTHLTFRYWWEYSGGTITDWGAHHNDIVLWALDMDASGPTSVEGKATIEMIPDGFTAASEYELDFTYPSGVTHKCVSTKGSAWNGETVKDAGQPHGIKFTGSDGWLWVTRATIDAKDRKILTEKLTDKDKRVYFSNDHMANFIDCVKTRKDPICPLTVGHRSATQCHLGVMAVRLGRKINWDPVKEAIVGDAEAAGMVKREMRKGFGYEYVG